MKSYLNYYWVRCFIKPESDLMIKVNRRHKKTWYKFSSNLKTMTFNNEKTLQSILYVPCNNGRGNNLK
jgi:hypothetical protein